jgi:hypothetical protein
VPHACRGVVSHPCRGVAVCHEAERTEAPAPLEGLSVLDEEELSFLEAR